MSFMFNVRRKLLIDLTNAKRIDLLLPFLKHLSKHLDQGNPYINFWIHCTRKCLDSEENKAMSTNNAVLISIPLVLLMLCYCHALLCTDRRLACSIAFHSWFRCHHKIGHPGAYEIPPTGYSRLLDPLLSSSALQICNQELSSVRMMRLRSFGIPFKPSRRAMWRWTNTPSFTHAKAWWP